VVGCLVVDLGLESRVVVITGANAGIGLATARAFVAEGARVVVGDIQTETLEHELGDAVDTVRLDLATPGGPAQLADAAREIHGRIDVLVNNVGAAHNRSSFLDVSDDEWSASINLNLLTMVRMCRAVLPTMVEQGSGSIVSVASDAARQPEPLFVDYCAAKAGVLALSKALSIEFGPHGIRSNAVTPGPTRTKQFEEFFEKSAGPEWGMSTDDAIDHFAKNIRRLPIGHVGRPEDVARAILYLASEVAGQVTGSEYRIDGGAITYA
jgi:NAD(P)-dependent dehydrogenase (short-subunit alcohol dehydrogenase family)